MALEAPTEFVQAAETALEAALAGGATHVEARVVREERESLSVEGKAVKGVERAEEIGIGVRVVAEGVWGFAGVPRLDPGSAAGAARLALEVARSSRPLARAPVKLAPVAPATASWSTSYQRDPFQVPLDEKVSLLTAATRAMLEVKGVVLAEAMADFWKRSTLLLTSEGHRIYQVILHTGAGIQATAVEGDEVQVRSYPSSFRGDFAAAGYEFVEALRLVQEAPRVAEEAVALLKAEECPAGETNLVIDGQQVALQLHESVGHPLELDRILGSEVGFAGASFVRPEDRGRLRYGSAAMNVVADATSPGGLGTFAYDDEGTPAQRVILVEEGVLQGFLSSREDAQALGLPSGGAARAAGWAYIPLVRMTNVNLEPGEASLEELLEMAGEGIFMASNRSWSIDDRRVNFNFGCEVAWEIKRGRLGRMLRNPVYTGRTTEFWGKLAAVGSPETWKLWGTPNCGKGQPEQVARVGHGTAPALFLGVQVGSAR